MKLKDWARAVILLFIVTLVLVYFVPPQISQLYSLFNFPKGNYILVVYNVTPQLVMAVTEGLPLGYNLSIINSTPYETFANNGPYLNATLKLLSMNASVIPPTPYFEVANAFGALVNMTPGRYVVNYTLHAFKIVNSSPNVLLILRLWNMTASPWYNVTYPPSSNVSKIWVQPLPSGYIVYNTRVAIDWYNYYAFDCFPPYEYTYTVGNVTYEEWLYFVGLDVYGYATLYVNGKALNTTFFSVSLPWWGGTRTYTIYGNYDGYTVTGQVKVYSPGTCYFENYTIYEDGKKIVVENWTYMPSVTPPYPEVIPKGGTVMITKYNVYAFMIITVYNGTDPTTYVGDTPVARGDGTFIVHSRAYYEMVANRTYNVTLNITTRDTIWFKLNGSWWHLNRTWLAAQFEIIATPHEVQLPNNTAIYILTFHTKFLKKNVPPNWIFNNTFAEVYRHNDAYQLMQMGYYGTIYEILFNFTNWYTKGNPYIAVQGYQFEVDGLVMQIAYSMNYTNKTFNYPIQALWAKEGNVTMRAAQQWYIASFGEFYYVAGNVSLLQEYYVPPTFLNITLWNKVYNYSKQYITNYTNSYPPLVYWLGKTNKFQTEYYFIFIETIDPAYLGNTSNVTWVYENLDKVWIPKVGQTYKMYDYYIWFPLASIDFWHQASITIYQWVNISYFYYTVWKVEKP